MKTLLTIYCTLTLMATYAQEPDKILVKVQYNYIHINDTTKKNRPHNENMVLLAGKNASLYLSADKTDQYIQNIIRMEQREKTGIDNQPTHGGEVTDAMRVSKTQYYFFNRSRKFFSMEDTPVDNCLVEDNIETIDWKIAKDTLSFSGIHCQKATARYKGRIWIAWFAADLPFEAGPWKLRGLPGLIVEAYDDKKEVQFKFNGIQKVKTGDLISDKAEGLSAALLKKVGDFLVNSSSGPGVVLDMIALPPPREARLGGYINVSKKEFDKIQDGYKKDPIGFEDAQMAARYASMRVTPPSIKNTPRPQPPKSDINNPIELPE